MRTSHVSPAIRTEHLTKIYRNRLIAVNDMSLSVPEGSIFGLLGPNGAGKTTTLRLIMGLQRPTAGRVEVQDMPCGPNAVAVRKRIGYLPTHPSFPGNLRPIEYLDLVGKLCRLPAQQRRPRIASLVRAVGLLGLTEQRIENLSTGETTRLGIAASLVGDPPLLIWDEPTAGLDPAARRFTLDLIRELGKSRTIVVATHILGDIDRICDHVGVMHAGRMIFCGPVQDMKRRLRRDDFCLELEGRGEDVQRLAEQAGDFEGVAVRLSDRQTLAVAVPDGRSRAAVLAEVLQLIEPNRLTLQSVHSGRNETEHAYLQLLQEDEAHGFQRFDIPSRRGDDAAAGDSSA